MPQPGTVTAALGSTPLREYRQPIVQGHRVRARDVPRSTGGCRGGARRVLDSKFDDAHADVEG